MKRLLALLFAALAPLASAQGGDEVPFVVTPDNVTLAMLQLAGVGPEDYLIDLGSGDGRIVITAAKRFGARGLGIEIVPDLVAKARANARAAGVSTRALFREQDLFKTDLAPASVVTMYLLPEANLQLRPRILQLRPGTRIVSHDWDMGEWKPDKTISVPAPDKTVGLDKTSKLHLWTVPARVQGDWCGTGKAKGVLLRLAQDFQRFRGEITASGVTDKLEGRIQGFTAGVPKQLNFILEGEKLRAQAINRKFSPVHRALFVRDRSGTCK